MRSGLYLLLAGIAMLILAGPAHADVKNLGDMINAANTNTFRGVWGLIKVATLPLGLMLMWGGLARLKAASESHKPLTAGFVGIFAGAAMISIPKMTEVIGATVGVATAIGSKSGFNAGIVNASGGGEGIIAIAGRFFSIVSSPLSSILIAFAFVGGVCLVIKGLYDCVALANPESGKRTTYSGVITTFVVGALMINLSGLMGIVGATFGMSGTSLASSAATAMMSYSGSATSLNDMTGDMAKMIAQGLIPFGAIAFLRGMLMLRRVADGNPRGESLGAGFTHIVGGIGLCNAMAVTCAAGATFTTTGIGFCG